MAVMLQQRRFLNPKDDMITVEKRDKDLSTERYTVGTSARTHKCVFLHTLICILHADLIHSCEFNGKKKCSKIHLYKEKQTTSHFGESPATGESADAQQSQRCWWEEAF